MKNKVYLVDDHQMVIDGFRNFLEQKTAFSVVGSTSDPTLAVEEMLRLKPEILVVDLMMPALSGFELIRRIRDQLPAVKIIVASMHASIGYVHEAFRLGAHAYVLKQAPLDEIVSALDHVIAGRRYMSSPLSVEMLDRYAQTVSSVESPLDVLSDREREVFHEVVHGRTSRQIAERMGISRRTVETHRANLMEKLSLGSQGELLRLAIRLGLIDANP